MGFARYGWMWNLALVLGVSLGQARDNAATDRRGVGKHAIGETFRDREASCPEMVVLPPGKFINGSPANEAGRGSDENPQKVINIGYALAVSKYPVTRGEFAAFARETDRQIGPCEHWDGKSFHIEEGVYWSKTLEQTDRHPVVCVNWDDSQAYAQWLSKKTGKHYRLLSEAEWEYTARAGTSTAWYWGNNETEQCRYGNGADLSAKSAGVSAPTFVGCDDKYAHTSPVGGFRPNAFGVYDMAEMPGNGWRTVIKIPTAIRPTTGARVRRVWRNSTTLG